MVLLRRFVENEAAQSSDSTTYKLEMSENGILSALLLKFRATNGSTSNKDNMIKDNISRIELIGDGSEILLSLTGEELDRIVWQHQGRRGNELSSEAANAVQFQTFLLKFGREIGDLRYGIDLAAYKDLRLRLTYNLATVNAVGATGFVSGSFNVTVVEYRYPSRDNVRPIGYRRIREFVQPTDAASGVRRYEIPLEFPLLAVHTFVREDNVPDDTDVTALQLEANNGELRIVDSNFDDLQAENAIELRINSRQVKEIFKSDTDVTDFETGIIRNINLEMVHAFEGTSDVEQIAVVESVSGDRFTLGLGDLDLNAGAESIALNTTDQELRVSVDGDGVGNLATMRLSRQEDWSDALNTADIDKLELVITSGASGATLGAVTEEIAIPRGSA